MDNRFIWVQPGTSMKFYIKVPALNHGHLGSSSHSSAHTQPARPQLELTVAKDSFATNLVVLQLLLGAI